LLVIWSDILAKAHTHTKTKKRIRVNNQSVQKKVFQTIFWRS
jgi:hypothetical protein